MKAHGIRTTYHAYKAGRRPGGYAEIADNLSAKTPQATAAGQQWAGDMTYLKTQEGPLYMAAVLDLFNREVIAWGFSRTHDADRRTGACELARWLRDAEAGCVVSSD